MKASIRAVIAAVSAVTAVTALFPGTAWAKSTSTVAPKPSRPVRVTEGLCVEGKVVGLSSKGRVTVRSAPSAKAKQLDRLPNNMFVFACEAVDASGVQWVGIVYSRVGHGEECGEGVDSEPATTSSSYGPKIGPCWSGWVTNQYLTVDEG